MADEFEVLNEYNKDDVFKIDNESSVSFKSLLALLSRAHGESYEWIQKNLPSQKSTGGQKRLSIPTILFKHSFTKFFFHNGLQS